MVVSGIGIITTDNICRQRFSSYSGLYMICQMVFWQFSMKPLKYCISICTAYICRGFKRTIEDEEGPYPSFLLGDDQRNDSTTTN